MGDKKSDLPPKSILETIFEFGHKAVLKDKPSKDSSGQIFTHDWEVYVKNPKGDHIENFVEKVVFHLHPSFDEPVRKVTKPPFKVSEQGYGGFTINFEIFFRVSYVVIFMS